MLKHTPPDHKEHTELGQVGLLDIMMVMVITHPQALNYMKNLNGEVNEAKRQQEEEERLLLQDEKDMAILGNLQRTIKSMKLESNQKLQVTEGQRRMEEGQRRMEEGEEDGGRMNSPPLQDFGRLRRAGELSLEGENTDYAFLLDSIMLVCNRPRLMQQRSDFLLPHSLHSPLPLCYSQCADQRLK